MERGLKGAAFIASVMCECQKNPLDMLMYYDARPCGMNGMFNMYDVSKTLKGYYPFYMFNVLYGLGNEAKTVVDGENGYAVAAVGENEAAVMLTHYNNDDTAAPLQMTVDLQNFGADSGVRIEYYLLDETRDLTLVGEGTYYGARFAPTLTLPNFTSYLIKLKKI